MGYAESEWERAMRVQEVMMRALSGELHWFRAAEILGVDVRTMRRWRGKFERNGCHRRRREPRACFGELLHLDGSPHAWLALAPDERPSCRG